MLDNVSFQLFFLIFCPKSHMTISNLVLMLSSFKKKYPFKGYSKTKDCILQMSLRFIEDLEL